MPPVAPRQRRTAIVAIRPLMNTCTALATPRPPRRRATSATRPRKLPKRESVSVRRRWSSETVRTLRRSAESRGRKRSASFWASAPGRQAQVGLVAGARAAGQEPGLLDARAGDEEARAEGAAHAHVARHVLDRGPQHEARLAEGDLVADRRAEGDEQRGVGDRATRLGESGPLAGGRRLDRAVERVAGVDGQHLGQPRRLAPRLEDHGPEAHHARHVGGGARRPAQLAEERLGGLREGRGGGESEVGAEQCPGLALDGPSQVVREGVDGDEGADADRHREDDEQPPARLGPRLAPGEGQDEA